jgi:hypothetical protein
MAEIINCADSSQLSRALYQIERFALGGQFDLYQDDRIIATVSPSCLLAEISYGKLILSCWGEGWARSWRIALLECEPDRLLLRCPVQMGRRIAIVELRRGAIHSERGEFAKSLARLIESSLPGLSVKSSIAAADPRRHLSGTHARLVLTDGKKLIAGIGASDREDQSEIDAALGAGLIWLDALRQSNHIDRLAIFVPRGRSITIATRLTMINPPGATISLYEFGEDTLYPIKPFDQGDLLDNLRSAARRALWPKDIKMAALGQQIINLAPGIIQYHNRGNQIAFSIRGLEFARISRNRAQFGIAGHKRKLSDDSWGELEQLVGQIICRRNPSGNPADPLFRLQAERWLEDLIRRNVAALDPTLDPRYVYSQVPTYRGPERAFVDLLAITQQGQLAVIELKVAEDADFPFQGLDYWLRVDWHRRRGDFTRRGYFGQLEIADQPPLLYLVAPLFRFHAATKLLAGSISSQVPVYRIGINEDWRGGVRALLTERLN